MASTITVHSMQPLGADAANLEIPLPLPTTLRGVDWEQYVQLSDHPDNSGVHMIFDEGVLYLMPPTSFGHEDVGRFVEWLVLVFVEEKDLAIKCVGHMTCRRKDLQKGLEPDNCYYIEHEAQMRGVKKLDLTTHPPPDLVIEVEVTVSVAPKLSIYAAMGVPEVWRWSGEMITILRLNEDKSYEQATESIALPGFPLSQAIALLKQRETRDATSLAREFRGSLTPPGQGG